MKKFIIVGKRTKGRGISVIYLCINQSWSNELNDADLFNKVKADIRIENELRIDRECSNYYKYKGIESQ